MCDMQRNCDKQTVCVCVCTEISLDVDADRDGVVEKNNANKVSSKVSDNFTDT